MKNKKVMVIQKVNNESKVNFKLWDKLDSLNKALCDNIEHAKQIIMDNGFEIDFILRDEIFFRGNGIKKTRSVRIYDYKRFLEVF